MALVSVTLGLLLVLQQALQFCEGLILMSPYVLSSFALGDPI